MFLTLTLYLRYFKLGSSTPTCKNACFPSKLGSLAKLSGRWALLSCKHTLPFWLTPSQHTLLPVSLHSAHSLNAPLYLTYPKSKLNNFCQDSLSDNLVKPRFIISGKEFYNILSKLQRMLNTVGLFESANQDRHEAWAYLIFRVEICRYIQQNS